MNRLSILAVVLASFLFCACGQEPSSQPQGKPETKPAIEAAPAPPAAPQPATVASPPVAPVATTPNPAAKPVAAPPPEPPAKPKSSAAADTAPPLPTVADIITLKASQGDVTLSHLAHARRYPCASCHGEASPGKFDLTKESAHTLCRDCHKARGAGPTACGECHKK